MSPLLPDILPILAKGTLSAGKLVHEELLAHVPGMAGLQHIDAIFPGLGTSLVTLTVIAITGTVVTVIIKSPAVQEFLEENPKVKEVAGVAVMLVGFGLIALIL